jgi:hypothetical protein
MQDEIGFYRCLIQYSLYTVSRVRCAVLQDVIGVILR